MRLRSDPLAWSTIRCLRLAPFRVILTVARWVVQLTDEGRTTSVCPFPALLASAAPILTNRAVPTRWALLVLVAAAENEVAWRIIWNSPFGR